MELTNKEIGHRRLFAHTAWVAWDRKEHVAVDDHGLVLNEDAVWVGVIRRQNGHFDPIPHKGLTVGLVLLPSFGDVRRP